ncbi:MAG: hypothetical protein IKT03_02140 [Muribaculaceae bacterium]|nr:hypothetical protein [Muribaculaceae bacterium]MBR6489313.1 hypothetical protein [Muribaculaceae bacterium]
MKKIFTLFAVALVGLCAFAQEGGPCPAQAQLAPAADEQPADKVMVYIQIKTSSENLNGFNSNFTKCLNDNTNTDPTPSLADEGPKHLGTYCPEIEWLMDEEDEDWVGFSGYGNVILAMWQGVTDSQREKKLFQKCDLKCAIRNEGPGNAEQHLVCIEIHSDNDCYYFPVLEDFTTVARFTVSLAACADGEYVIIADNDPNMFSWSFTGGPEGTRAWTSDDPVKIVLNKVGDKVYQVVEGIDTIEAEQKVDNRIFDIMGRELQSIPETGIYIQNGKKYVK